MVRGGLLLAHLMQEPDSFSQGLVGLLELTHPGYKPRYDYGGMPVPIDGMPIVLRPLH